MPLVRRMLKWIALAALVAVAVVHFVESFIAQEKQLQNTGALELMVSELSAGRWKQGTSTSVLDILKHLDCQPVSVHGVVQPGVCVYYATHGGGAVYIYAKDEKFYAAHYLRQSGASLDEWFFGQCLLAN